jgi:hypothetical protein
VGPRFRFHAAQPGKWTLVGGDQSALVVGREDTLHLEDESTLCIDRVEEEVAGGSPLKLAWKSSKPGALEVTVPLKDAAPGLVTIDIHQFGLNEPDKLPLKAYAEAASLDRLTLSAGDEEVVLKGKRLDEVATAELDGIKLTPAALNRVQDFDQLAMSASATTANLEPGKHYDAKVELRDGRQLKVPVTVDPPRPQVILLSKGTQDESSAAPNPVHLGSLDDLPADNRLVFFLKSRVPANFPRDEKVEVAAVDGSFRTVLSLADGSLMLEDAKTAVGTLDPLARFGSSAFGPVQVRVIASDGVTGDWLPLGSLVRLPGFKELRCPRAPAKPCTLSGTNLFLASSIAATPDFDNSTDVPPEFTGSQLSVTHPAGGVLYLKLRDDPATAQTLTLPVNSVLQSTATPVQPTAASAQSSIQQAAAPAQRDVQPSVAPTQPAAPTALPAALPLATPAPSAKPQP